MHNNSLAAYAEEESSLSRRAQVVLDMFRSSPCALTDREVMFRLGFIEPNAVRPRITELVQLGYLQERGKTKCAVTGKQVRRVSLPDGTPVQMELFG
tara:strand:- start:601 stop:891 length:291 start_codon:yes stop_codon:yes gene_type:complete